MKINSATLELIKESEGFRSEAYRDQAGIWTIGYGTTAKAGVGIIPVPGMTITQEEAEWYLQKGIEKFSDAISSKISAPINENQFGAFVSLAYNIGPRGFAASSALRKFNEGDTEGAADAILLWNKITDPKTGKKVVSNGLRNRRVRERELFLRPVPAAPIPKTGTGGGFADILRAIIAALAALFRKK